MVFAVPEIPVPLNEYPVLGTIKAPPPRLVLRRAFPRARDLCLVLRVRTRFPPFTFPQSFPVSDAYDAFPAFAPPSFERIEPVNPYPAPFIMYL